MWLWATPWALWEGCMYVLVLTNLQVRRAETCWALHLVTVRKKGPYQWVSRELNARERGLLRPTRSSLCVEELYISDEWKVNLDLLVDLRVVGKDWSRWDRPTPALHSYVSMCISWASPHGAEFFGSRAIDLLPPHTCFWGKGGLPASP